MDLKWLLVRRITLVVLLCFIAGTGIALYLSAREAQQQNLVLTDLAQRHLELQLSRIQRSTQLAERFPDWDLISSFGLSPGQCVDFHGQDASKNRSSCAGFDTRSPPPAWFLEFYRQYINNRLSVRRTLVYRDVTHGEISASFQPAAIASTAWSTISPLLGAAALLAAVLCFVTYLVVDRALRPAQQILDGLNKLASGDLGTRLPRFELSELDRISHVFNTVTAELEKTTTERSEFARRLIDAQERERLHLARELHDEIAQQLAALNALAACIRGSAKNEAPHLIGEIRELETRTAQLMINLRRTLSYLRPQELDNLGLVSGLRALVENYNQNAKGRTQYTIDVGNDISVPTIDMSAHVYRIVQEALTNATKHSNARNVTVCVQEHGGANASQMRISVIDDGTGQESGVDGDVASGLGLIGIRERTAALNGTLEAGPLADGGFKLELNFPTRPMEGWQDDDHSSSR